MQIRLHPSIEGKPPCLSVERMVDKAKSYVWRAEMAVENAPGMTTTNPLPSIHDNESPGGELDETSQEIDADSSDEDEVGAADGATHTSSFV